jgi:TolA-binding protein
MRVRKVNDRMAESPLSGAAQTLLRLVQAAPDAAEAPEALLTAARVLERDGRFDEAAINWRRLGDEYPTHEFASTAMLFAGIMQYRQADYQAALPLFDRSLVLAVTTEDQARAHLWIGKVEKLNAGMPRMFAAGQITDRGGHATTARSMACLPHHR